MSRLTFITSSLISLLSCSLLSVVAGVASTTILLPENSSVQAQSQFTDEQINRYAKAVNAIEEKREEVLRRAKNSPEWNTVAGNAKKQGVQVCKLKPEEQAGIIQSLCRDFVDFSEKTIRDNGFKNNREFNQITQAQQQDSQLQKRIQLRIRELRQPK